MTTEPNIRLRQLSAARDGATNLWNVLWQVDNRGGDTLTILAARLPHGQFRAEEQSFVPGLALPPGGSAEFHSRVYCNEPVGLVTENAFVIFHCQWRSKAWRIFIRIRVTVGADGLPDTATELITTQKVGFSGVAN